MSTKYKNTSRFNQTDLVRAPVLFWYSTPNWGRSRILCMQQITQILSEDSFHHASVFSDSPTDTAIVSKCCLSCTSRLLPFDGGTQLSHGWMSCCFPCQTPVAYICLIKTRGAKNGWHRAFPTFLLHFSGLFFGGSYDNIVHHILTAGKQLLKHKDSSVLEKCRKSLCEGCFDDASRPTEVVDTCGLQQCFDPLNAACMR